MKRFLSIMLAIMMAISLVACGSGNNANNAADSGNAADAGDASAEPETIRIGVVAPLTGESSYYGAVISETVTMLAEQQNEAGGLLGKEIEVLVYDNRGDAVETTNAARKAITNDEVVAFVGTDSSATTIALVGVASEYHIPVISSIATNVKVTMDDDGNLRPYAFRACLTDTQYAEIMGEYVVDELGYKKIAVIYDIGSDYSVGNSTDFIKTAEAHGAEIVAQEASNTGDVDFRAVLTKIKNAGEFDTLYIAMGGYKEVGLIANQARELGIDAALTTTEAAMSPYMLEMSQESCQGMVFYGGVDAKSDQAMEQAASLNEAFEARWGYDPSEYMGPDCYLAHDATKMLFYAIEDAGVVDSEAIAESLANTTEVQGLFGTITIDPETHLVYREIPIYRIVDDGYELLERYFPAE